MPETIKHHQIQNWVSVKNDLFRPPRFLISHQSLLPFPSFEPRCPPSCSPCEGEDETLLCTVVEAGGWLDPTKVRSLASSSPPPALVWGVGEWAGWGFGDPAPQVGLWGGVPDMEKLSKLGARQRRPELAAWAGVPGVLHQGGSSETPSWRPPATLSAASSATISKKQRGRGLYCRCQV